MLDEVIITETPPLYCCYGRCGQQVCVPITGNRAKRILHGVINVVTGELSQLLVRAQDAIAQVNARLRRQAVQPGRVGQDLANLR